MKTKWLLTLMILLGSLGCGPAQEKKTAATRQDVDVAEFARLAANTNNVVLDVRTPREFASGHLPGAINLNLRATDFVVQAERLNKGRTYLVHCAVGARSLSACQKLEELGFTNLINLKTGLKGWEATGRPLQK